MDKDPLLLKDEEVDKIVAYLRNQYAEWVAEEQKAQMDERKAKTSKGTSEKKAKSVSLDDLGL